MSYKTEQKKAKQALKKTNMLWEGYDKDGVGKTLDLGIKKEKKASRLTRGSVIKKWKQELWAKLEDKS